MRAAHLVLQVLQVTLHFPIKGCLHRIVMPVELRTKMSAQLLLIFGLCTFVYAVPRPFKHHGVVKNTAHSHTLPTYFRRMDRNGHLIDRESPEYGQDIHFPIIEEISRYDKSHAVLKVKPLIVKNGEIVTVSWGGVWKPTAKDWIALLCPRMEKIKYKLDHFFVDVSPTWHKGYGSHNVHVFNMRENCEFRYFRNDKHSSRLVARSNKIGFEFGALAPLQGRIALTGNPTEMRVMWTAAKCKSLYSFLLYESENQI